MSSPDPAAEQLPLLAGPAQARQLARTASRAARARSENQPTADLPIARVLVDTGLAHLDRVFEYLVPDSMASAAQPGVRVKVRFAGKDSDGFLIERADDAQFAGALSPLRRVVSPEQVLTPPVLATARLVADRKGGSLMDVLRLAIPPRHARVEKAALPDQVEPGAYDDPGGAPGLWSQVQAGPAFISRISRGQAPGASWVALPASDPGTHWSDALAAAAAAALAAGRGSILIAPDHRDVARLEAAVNGVAPGLCVRLTSDQGPAQRYRAFLAALRGQARIVVGTRSAAFAPVAHVGLVAWWDDGDDLHQEPRTPYPHVREILLARAEVESSAILSGGYARTASVEMLIRQGRLADVSPARSVVRAHAPRVVVSGSDLDQARDAGSLTARLPSVAWRAAKEALANGPVLVQVPRSGYIPVAACASCRAAAQCPSCGGPLGLSDMGLISCRWCHQEQRQWRCPDCANSVLRSVQVGVERTAEELGRAFPGISVNVSAGERVLSQIGDAPALVVATPGAEPSAPTGYAAALLLDGWVALARPTLGAAEEALRRWLGAAALVRARDRGGVVVLTGIRPGPTLPAVEALAGWSPGVFAAREYDERAALALPPCRSSALITGDLAAVRDVLATVQLPPGCLVTEPEPAQTPATAVVLCDPALADDFAAAWRQLRAQRSARHATGRVTIKLDPMHLGI